MPETAFTTAQRKRAYKLRLLTDVGLSIEAGEYAVSPGEFDLSEAQGAEVDRQVAAMVRKLAERLES